MKELIVIPSLNPDHKFMDLLAELRVWYEGEIVVVNDGSDLECDDFFSAAVSQFDVKLLKHAVNLGKGRALKTAINYVLNQYPNIDKLIIVDDDGQHSVKDVRNIVNEYTEGTLALGTRSFGKDVPFRSKAGNLITAKVLKFFTRIDIADTQTGLRAIPQTMLKPLLKTGGERYEFEFNMLMLADEMEIPLVQIPISTIYIDNNSSSHFNPLTDSLKIYKVFIKYLASSLVSSFVDVAIFTILLILFGQTTLLTITLSTFGARLTSSLINYLINKNLVFNAKTKDVFIKYITLVVLQFMASSFFVYSLTRIFNSLHPTYIKVVVDGFLFIVSYTIQQKLIFRSTNNEAS